MNFITSFLEGHDELSIALGNVPATVDDDEGGFDGGHDLWRLFFFFCSFCVRDARTGNLGILKKTDADGPLAWRWRIHPRFANGNKSGHSAVLQRSSSVGASGTATGFAGIYGRKVDWFKMVGHLGLPYNQTPARCCILRLKL